MNANLIFKWQRDPCHALDPVLAPSALEETRFLAVVIIAETKAKLTAPAADSPIEIERAVEAAILPVVQGLRKQNFRGTMDKNIPMKKSRFTGVQMISVLRQAEGGIPFPEP